MKLRLGTSDLKVGQGPGRVALRPARACRRLLVASATPSSSNTTESNESQASSFKWKPLLPIVALAACTVALGMTNRVLSKMVLVPLKEYVFFLAQFMTFGYVAVYFSVLLARTRIGKVPPEMFRVSKRKFAFMGFLEASGLTLGLLGALNLPGAILPVASQMFLFWQLLFSALLLGRRYTLAQLGFCAVVVSGVVFASSAGLSSVGSMSTMSGKQYLAMSMYVLSLVPPALTSILKESVFRDARRQLGGRELDIFIVNSFTSGFQALFVLLQLPLIASLQGIPLTHLPGYLRDGWLTFSGAMPNAAGAPTPLLPLLYVAVNLVFNISVLRLLRSTSSVVVTFTMTLCVPLTVMAFSLPLPYLGVPSPITPQFWTGVALLVAGLIGYNVAGEVSKRKVANAS